jgi:hypothetical protein
MLSMLWERPPTTGCRSWPSKWQLGAFGRGGAPTASRPSSSERTESSVVRIFLTGEGRPTRSVVVHVRTQTELPLAGWSPEQLTRFILEQGER